MRRVLLVWRSLVARGDAERQMADELAFHIEARAADLMTRGALSREQALRQARLEFGSVERYKEEGRASRGLRLADELSGDLRFARRTLVRHRGFAAAAVAILALGIGTNTAVFGVVDALLSELPVDRPSELVAFDSLHRPDSMLAGYSGSGRPGPDGTIRRTSFSADTFERFRRQATTLSDVFAVAPLGSVTVADDAGAEMANAQLVSGSYHRGLGVGPAIGRMLQPADDRAGAAAVAVISHRYWERRYLGDAGITGKTLRVNGVPFTIVGVTRAGFDGTRVTETTDVTLPLAHAAQLSRTGTVRPISVWWLLMMGRLKPGATREQVRAELGPVFEDSVRVSWSARQPGTRDPWRSGMPVLRVMPGAQGPDGPPAGARNNVTLVFMVSGVVLLIACVNVASLMLVRAAGRRPEMAMRRALGASRGRLIRQLLSETGLLAVAGAAGGLLLALEGKDWLVRLFEPDAVLDTAIDLRALAFAGGLATITALAVGVGYALRATKADLAPALKSAGAPSGRRRTLIAPALIGMQIAACLVLLVSAGLLVQTLYNYSRVEIGFDPRNMLVFRLDPAPSASDPAQAFTAYERVLAALDAVPGVRAATLSAVPLVAESEWTDTVRTDPASPGRGVRIQAVRWNFFETMGMPLLAGRVLQPSDTAVSPAVAVINEELARQVFGEASPIGRTVAFVNGSERDVPIRVVGIVRDAKYARLSEEPLPALFRPYQQVPPRRMVVEVRADGDPLPLVPGLRAAIRRVDPDLPLIDLRTQEQQIAETIRGPRVFALLTGLAGGIGLLLASVGLYGVVSYDARRRTSEIGVRLALGARQRDVVRLVMGQTFWVVALGAALGVGLATVATRLIAGQLFGVEPIDPWTLGTAAALLAAVGLLAGYVPARRAARLDPTLALRYE